MKYIFQTRFDRSMMEMFSWVHINNCWYSKKILTIWRRLSVIHKFTILSLSLTSIFHNKECFLFVWAISYTATLATHYFFNYAYALKGKKKFNMYISSCVLVFFIFIFQIMVQCCFVPFKRIGSKDFYAKFMLFLGLGCITQVHIDI